LITNPQNRTSVEAWQNNFSTFFDINNSNDITLGTIGFSTSGISLFDTDLSNRRDFSLGRDR
jgi:hypothetical protein